MAAVRPSTPGGGLSRRTLLAGLLAVPSVLAGCSLGGPSKPSPPDPLIALAASARADAELAAAAVAAQPALADRVEPLRVARTEHAAAMEAEVTRRNPGTAGRAPSAPATADDGDERATLPSLREAIAASAKAASDAVLELPVEQVGLVASVAACCGTYAKVLG